jgi:hypothetical protein
MRWDLDAVVDWVVFTPEHVQAAIDLFRGRAGQYVFISAYRQPGSIGPQPSGTSAPGHRRRAAHTGATSTEVARRGGAEEHT